MPALELRTAPLPATPTVSRYVMGAKSADTEADGETDTEHDPLPVQAPPQ